MTGYCILWLLTGLVKLEYGDSIYPFASIQGHLPVVISKSGSYDNLFLSQVVRGCRCDDLTKKKGGG